MTTINQGGRARSPLATFALAACLLALGACSNGNSHNDKPKNFEELIAQGIARYLGLYTPMLTEQANGITTYTFGAGDGPLCQDGSEYKTQTFDQGSANLVIFMEGGGACWSTLCSSSERAQSLTQAGILDPNLADNPVRGWNQVYIPYCDGGLHASDADNDYDNDGIAERPQRGLHNLSAALDVAVTTFPNPARILLTGQSGGGYGTTFALPLVRHLYPGVPIDVVNDSGVGIGQPGDPSFIRMLQDDWNQSAFIPESCPDCIGADGHLTNYLKWQMDQDQNLRRSMLSSKGDFVIASAFLQIGAQRHEEALVTELAEMEAAHPDRFRSWVTNGIDHTYIQRNPNQTAGGVRAIDFISAQINGTDDWVSTSD